MADHPSRIKGFFSSCWQFKADIVRSWDALGFAVALVAAYLLPTGEQITKLSESLATAAIALGAALVGVVVAGLAVVVALLDDELLQLMDRDEKSGRVPGHLFPYWFVTGLGVVAFLLALILLLAGPSLPGWATRVLFAAVCGFVVWTALGVFNLVGSLNALGINRATAARPKREG